MNVLRRRPVRALELAALLLVAVLVFPRSARAQVDVIRGRVTNTEGLPLQGVRVTATSIPGSVTRETRTDNRGAFQIAFANGPGDYMMGFALIGYVYRQFEVKRLADEDVLIANAQMGVIQFDTVSVVATQQQRVSRFEQNRDPTATEQTVDPSILDPGVQGDLAAMAASLPGVLLIPGLDGAADGFSVLGLGADQNSVTLNGGMELGASGLPRDASITTSLTTSSFDVSRGGFSGGNLNVRSQGGTNIRTRGTSMVLNAPQLQWTDPAARALGTEYTNFSLGGVASGPISYNKAFYNISWQVGRDSRDNQTLLETNALGLRTAGVAMDSVSRFVDILDARGVPLAGWGTHGARVSDNASLFATFDVSPPGSSSGNSFNVTVNGGWNRQSPVGGGATQLASAGGDRMSWNGGLQTRHSGYLGMLLSESSIGGSISRNEGRPYLELPAGRVRINSVFEDGVSGVQTLVFGGNQGLSSRSQSVQATAQNTLSWFDGANKHRIKLSTELRYQGSVQTQANNLLGSYSYNSLEELEAGTPASFSRTLNRLERSTGVVTASASLGDSWRWSQDLQIQYGLRLDASHFTALPARNPLVQESFGRRNDRIPTPVAISPRIGFSYTVGRVNEIDAFFGQARSARGVLRGGIGLFANAAGQGQLGQIIDQTGLPSGLQQIVCVGPAVPSADWAAYANDPALIPSACADGTSGTVFSNGAPNVTLLATDFRPQRTVRSNLSYSTPVLDNRFNASVEGTYSLNLGQQRSVDLNFAPDVRFTLATEGGSRPVFVNPTSIVPATGSVASRDARVTQSFARVTELRSDLQSRTAQVALRLSPIQRGPLKLTWNLAYTYAHIREQVNGFQSTNGNPLHVEWGHSSQGPHQINYGFRWNAFNSVQVNWSGSFRSGAAYTPMVGGDINGDGYGGNDRAFIWRPGDAPDTAIANGMQRLLATTSGAARECLERQSGVIAARNSCRAPWSSSATLNLTLDRVKFRMPQRVNVSFSLANPLGAADLLLNGSGHLKGWGQSPSPDQALLYVRGFDPATNRYIYEVNQRFGATRPQFLTLRSPVTLTTSVKVDLGPVREQQQLEQQLNGRRSIVNLAGAEMARRVTAAGPAAIGLSQDMLARTGIPMNFSGGGLGSASLPNSMVTILAQADTLRLTAVQADSIASMNRTYTYHADSLWKPVTRFVNSPDGRENTAAVLDLYFEARRAQIDMLMQYAPLVHALLTPEQRRKLPPSMSNLLDARYLHSIRNGTGTYVR